MKNPLISILIPAYKSQYLHKCINSIKEQTYSNWEIIVVDDCSPEGLHSIISEYNDPRVHYYRNANNYGAVNVVDNWNKCLEYASGDYCICIGDDDMLPVDALDCYLRYIKKYPNVDVFHARTVLIDQEDKPIFITNTRAEHESVFSLIRHRMNDELQFVGDFCYRISKLREMGGYKKFLLAWGSDDVTAYMMAEENGIVNIKEPTFYYRVNQLSITSTGNIDLKIEAVEEQRNWFAEFFKRNTNLSIEDVLALSTIKQNIDQYLDKKIAGYISDDIRNNRLKLFFWLRNKKKFNISKYALKYGIMRSFK